MAEHRDRSGGLTVSHPDLEWRETVRGAKPGDRYVRVATHKGFTRIRRGYLVPRRGTAVHRQKGNASMPMGTVKWFNPTKGYGFIAPDTGGKDVFVHISAVQKAGFRSLSEGQKIGFEIEQQQNGRTAAVNLSQSD